MGLLGQWHMQRDHIGAHQQIVKGQFLYPQLGGTLFRQIGVIGDDMDMQTARSIAYDLPDVAHADDPQGLVGKFSPQKARFFPFARMGRGVGRRNLPGDGKHQGDAVLGSGDGVAKGRVHDDHAPPRGLLRVDIIDADAGATNDFQICCGFKDSVAHPRGRAHRKPIVGGDLCR